MWKTIAAYSPPGQINVETGIELATDCMTVRRQSNVLSSGKLLIILLPIIPVFFKQNSYQPSVLEGLVRRWWLLTHDLFDKVMVTHFLFWLRLQNFIVCENKARIYIFHCSIFKTIRIQLFKSLWEFIFNVCHIDVMWWVWFLITWSRYWQF